MKFRKKPVVVEAWQVGSEPVPHWIDVALANDDLEHTNNKRRWLMRHDTCHDGFLEASKGDWIIRGIKGDLYPCPNDVFQATHEPHDEEGT